MLTLYRRVCYFARALENTVLLSSLALLIVLTVLQILLRNFFSTSISWVEPLNQHLVLVIGFVGAMVAGRNGEHISFDVFKRYLPEGSQRFFSILGAVLSALVCFWLAYICSEMVYLDYLDPIPAFAKVSQWVFEIFIPLGFLVIGYRLIKYAMVKV